MADEMIGSAHWERKTLEKLLFNTLKEQRRRRRWGIFFKILTFIFLFLLIMLIWPSSSNLPSAAKTKQHISLVDIQGVIDDNGNASADNIISGLQDAFEDRNTAAVVVRLDSPGGSPVQASQIYNQIRYLRTRYPKTKVYAVCDDLCASAAYYIASSCDAIYADKASLVGSIGVVMEGFGFVDTLKKVGVQRRLMTAGSHKGFLDPFSPLKPNEQQIAQTLLDNVHQQFINAVKSGRGDRLKNNPELFSGLAWTGQQALGLGLIDGFGDLHSVARDVVHTKYVINYTVKPGLLMQLTDKMGTTFAQQIGTELGIYSKELH